MNIKKKGYGIQKKPIYFVNNYLNSVYIKHTLKVMNMVTEKK